MAVSSSGNEDGVVMVGGCGILSPSRRLPDKLKIAIPGLEGLDGRWFSTQFVDAENANIVGFSARACNNF
jgi:hypothetical protein